MNISSTRVIEKIFYSNDLYYSYIFDFERLKDFYKYDYRSLEGFRQKTENILGGYKHGDRKNITDILLGLNEDLGCSEKTRDNISKLKSRNVFTVTAGQQPGLFTGPIYTIYKAMTAISLSQSLSRELGIEVIPVFWNASDDSLTEEALNAFIYDTRGNLEKISIDPGVDNNRRLSNISVKSSYLDQSIKRLFSEMGSTDFSDELIKLLTQSLQKKEDISLPGFFSSLILRLFRHQGIVIIDPASRELKKLCKRLVQMDIKSSRDIKENIDRLGKKLEKKGFKPSLVKRENILDFFFNIDGRRHKVELKDDGFLIGKKKLDHRDLTGLLDSEPEKISLNVILRPMLQDSFLPNIATICGPGEVSYFAQLKEIYEIFGIDQSIIYPRFSATIIERKVSKSLKRQNIDPSGLSQDRKDNLKNALVGSADINIESIISELKENLESSLASAEKKLENIYSGDKSPFDRINRNMDKEVGVLRKKIISVLKRKNDIVLNDFEKIYENIFPEKKLQERKINIFYYMNQYGIDLIDEFDEKIDIFDFYHKFIEV